MENKFSRTARASSNAVTDTAEIAAGAVVGAAFGVATVAVVAVALPFAIIGSIFDEL